LPLLKQSPIKGARLLRIDIKALAEDLQNLEVLYDKNQISTKFETAIEELSQSIDHPDWSIEVDIVKALHYLVRFEGVDKAQQIISKRNPYRVSNPEFIELYIGLFADGLNHVEIVALAERVVSLTGKASSRLQYQLVAAVQFFLLNDMAEGEKRALRAIEEYEAIPVPERSTYGRFRLAGAYKMLGEVLGRDELILKAVDFFANVIAEESLNNAGLSDIWYEMGDCHRHLKDYGAAEKNYKRALELHKNPLVEVFLARVLMATSRQGEARKTLIDLDIAKFNENNLFDYAISWCELATTYRQRSDIDKALGLLKSVKTNDPLFMQLNKDLIIQLYDIRDDKGGEKAKSILERLNSYITLNPNIAGLGINFNAMFDDFIKRND